MSHGKRGFLLACLLVSFLTAGAAAGSTSAATAEGITAQSIRSHVDFLASDELAGRDSGEPGLEVAADYIAQRYHEYGLEPAGDQGTYFQHFTVPRGATFGGKPGATVRLPGGRDMEWAAGADVEAFGFDESGEVDAPLVFAGYGVTTTAGDKGIRYDDYAGLDVAGKVVIVLRFVPRNGKQDDPFRGRRSPHAPLVAKLKNAKEHGAAGVIFVTPPEEPEEELYGLAHRAAPRQPTLPALVGRGAVVDQLLRLEGRCLSGLVDAIDGDLKPRSFTLEGVSIRFATQRRYLRLRNVSGRLPGTDPALAREAVVIGAHYDHIGRYGNQVQQRHLGKVHNGADDNASGVAGVLELARVLVAERPRRTTVFVCFSGEEIGLLGSRHWVNSPRRFATRDFTRVYSSVPEKEGDENEPHGGNGSPRDTSGTLLWEGGARVRATGRFAEGMVEVEKWTGTSGWVRQERLELLSGSTPLHRVVAMINLDMIGHAKENGEVSILGAQSANSFPRLLEDVAKEVGVPVKISGGGMVFGGSDHMHFLRRSIPVLFFFTGMHAQYNTPEDDPDTINAEGEARILELIRRVVIRLGNGPGRPQFREQKSVSVAPRHGRPTLGIQLDPEYGGRGVRVHEIVADSPAAKSELRAGDVLTRFGDTEILGIPDLLSALDDGPQGKVSLVVRRGDQELKISVEFPTRRQGFRVQFGSVPDYAFAEQGVRFDDIRPDTPAARAGVKPGDVLVGWSGQKVENVESWTRLLREHRPGDEVQIEVRRGGKVIELTVKLEAR